MKTEKYLDAIIPVLKVEGLTLSMDVLAEKIGVTKKTLYNKFVSKDNMIDMCLKKTASIYRESLRVMDDQSLSIPERLQRGMDAVRDHFSDFTPKLMHDIIDLYPQRAKIDGDLSLHYFEVKMMENIEEGMRAGVYRSDIESDMMSKYLTFSAFYYYDKRVLPEGVYTAAEFFDQIAEFTINGLLAK